MPSRGRATTRSEVHKSAGRDPKARQGHFPASSFPWFPARPIPCPFRAAALIRAAQDTGPRCQQECAADRSRRGCGCARQAAVSVPLPQADQHFPPAQAVAGVHFQQPDRGASGGRFARNPIAIALEVVFPPFVARAEEWSELAGVRIKAGEVRASRVIALRTGQRGVGVIVRAAILPGDDVFQGKTGRRGMSWQPAVFAAVPSSLADKFAGGAVHSGRPGVGEKGVGLGREHPKQGIGANDGFEAWAHVIGRRPAAGGVMRGNSTPRPESIDLDGVLDSPGTPACLPPGLIAIRVGS